MGDGNNFGPSLISAFGDFTGGGLGYYPEDDGSLHLDKVKAKDKERTAFALRKNGHSNLVLFNGNSAHEVNDFQGTRFSLVYFTHGCHKEVDDEDRRVLQDFGIPVPSKDGDPYHLIRAPRGLGKAPSAADSKSSDKSTYTTHRLWTAAELEQQPFKPRKIRDTGAAAQLKEVMEL